MKRLYLADIHANLAAFEAVLDAAGAVDDVVFLGDAVGFGPQAEECVELLRELNPVAVRGNHDLRISLRGAGLPAGDGFRVPALSRESHRYLLSLPEAIRLESCGEETLAVHSSPSGDYLHPSMPDARLAAEFRGLPCAAAYCGHSHWLIERRVGGRRVVCFRAVGQPRDGDPRAGYAVEEGGVLVHRRVEYDVGRTADAIRGMDLPEPFLSRWVRFLETGHDPEWSRIPPKRTNGSADERG